MRLHHRCNNYVFIIFHSFWKFLFFFFNDTATTEIYTLSLHDALPICARRAKKILAKPQEYKICEGCDSIVTSRVATRSEEHTSELQSPCNLVCRLLLEKKKERELAIF